MADEFEGFDDIDALMAEGDDFDMGSDDADPSKPTSTLSEIKAGAMESINMDIDVAAGKIKNSMFDTLPGSLGSNLYDSESAIDSLGETFDKQLKPLKSATKGTLNAIAEVLPEDMADSVKSLKSWLFEDEESSGTYREPSEDEKISEEVNGILARSALEEQVNAKISNLQESKEIDLLKMIAEATSKTSIYKSEYDANFYKRSLEIQLKHLMTDIKLYELLKKDSEIRNTQFEALVKNTALPDFAKSRTSDIAKQLALGGMKDVATQAFTKNDMIKNVTKFGKEKITDGLSNAAEAIGFGEEVANALAMQVENGGSLIGSITSLLMDEVVDKTLSTTMDAGLKVFFETEGGAKVLGDYNKFAEDPQKAIEKLKTKHIEDGGSEDTERYKLLSVTQEAMGQQFKKNDAKINDVSGIREAAMLDNKFKKSVDTVIPGYLSKILNELSTIRKTVSGGGNGSGAGSTNNNVRNISGSLGGNSLSLTNSSRDNTAPQFDDELVFDFTKNMFVSKGGIKKNINKKLDEKVSSLASAIISSKLDTFLVQDHLSIPERTELAIALANYILDGKSIAGANLKSEGLLKYIKDAKLKKKVNNTISRFIKPETTLVLNDRTALETALTNIKKSNISNFSDIANDANLNNTSDVLLDMGITDSESSNAITFKNVSNVYKKRIKKQTEGKITKSKLTRNEIKFLEDTKKANEKLSENIRKKDDKIKRQYDRQIRKYRKDDIARKSFEDGVNKFDLNDNEVNNFIKENTKNLTNEETERYLTAFTLGQEQGRAEDLINKDSDNRRTELTKKRSKVLRKVTKKMSDEEREEFTNKVRIETKLEELGSFNLGGWTGDGDPEEIAGAVHKKEYVLNPTKLKELVSIIESNDIAKLATFNKNILEDISKQDNNLLTSKVKEIIKETKKTGKEYYDKIKENDIFKSDKFNIDDIETSITNLKKSLTTSIDSISLDVPFTMAGVKDSISDLTTSLSDNFDSLGKSLKDMLPESLNVENISKEAK